MSDFFIVLAVAILGLLAQSAAGKRTLRTAGGELGSRLGQTQAQTQAPVEAAAPHVPSTSTTVAQASPESPAQTPLAALDASGEIPTSSEPEVSNPAHAQALEPVQAKDAEQAAEPVQVKDVEQAVEPVQVQGAEQAAEPVQAKDVEQAVEPVQVQDAEQAVELVQVKDDVEQEEAAEPAQVKDAEQAVEPVQVQEPAPSKPVTAQGHAQTQTLTQSQAGIQIKPSPVKTQADSAFIVTNRKIWLEWILRGIIFLWFLGLALYFYISTSGLAPAEFQAFDPWVLQVTFVTCAFTGFSLVRSFRTLLSYVLSAIDCLFDWSVLKGSVTTWAAFKTAFNANRVFIPSSIPHMVGLFIYVQTMFYLLAAMTPKSDFGMPGMPIPLPLPLDQLFSYNGLGLVMLAFCGCGIFVTRQFKEVMRRLALVRPTGPQISLGIGLVLMSFLYDYLWSLYTHGMHLGLDSKLSLYNGGTFTAAGGFTGALVLAIATAIFAGVGEETLIRGALQPIFGIVPAAILHGVLHAQFQHAPIFIVQVAGWSILMGIAKRYTNTTTTIMGHAGFNFVTTFLFAFNPPDI